MDQSNTLATFNSLFPTDHTDPNRRSRLGLFAAWLNDSGKAWHSVRLDEYRDYLLHTRKLAPLSVKNHLATIRQRYIDLLEDNDIINILRVAARQSVINEGFEPNPANIEARVNAGMTTIRNNTSARKVRVKVPTVNEYEDGRFIRLSPVEIDQRLELIPTNKLGMRDAAICALLYACGLREQEGADADVSDLYQRYQGEPALRIPKGKNSTARMVVYGDMWCYIERYVIPFMETNGIDGGRVLRAFSPGSGLLLPSVSVDTIQNRVKMYMGCNPHDLRRSYARNLYDSGVDLLVIKQRLGHQSVQTTIGYIGLLDALDRKSLG